MTQFPVFSYAKMCYNISNSWLSDDGFMYYEEKDIMVQGFKKKNAQEDLIDKVTFKKGTWGNVGMNDEDSWREGTINAEALA